MISMRRQVRTRTQAKTEAASRTNGPAVHVATWM